MRIIEQQIFPYTELSTKAQEVVKNHHIQNMHGWHDSTIEDANQIAAYLGFNPFKIYYNGFYNQGDGACFVGEWRRDNLSIAKVKTYAPIDETLHKIAEELAKVPAETLVGITHVGHYCHENSMAYYFYPPQDDGGEEITVDETAIDVAFQRFAKWIYRQLEKQYEYECKDETIAEAVDENEYYEDGRLYTGD